jgi:hypothetical protein
MLGAPRCCCPSQPTGDCRRNQRCWRTFELWPARHPGMRVCIFPSGRQSSPLPPSCVDYPAITLPPEPTSKFCWSRDRQSVYCSHFPNIGHDPSRNNHRARHHSSVMCGHCGGCTAPVGHVRASSKHGHSSKSGRSVRFATSSRIRCIHRTS